MSAREELKRLENERIDMYHKVAELMDFTAKVGLCLISCPDHGRVFLKLERTFTCLGDGLRICLRCKVST